MLDTFDVVYVLNLPERKDRRSDVTKQLQRVGFEFGERIQLFDAIRPTETGGFRTLGAHGCFLSHLGALRAAAQRGAGSVLLLEDDVNFVDNFRESSAVIRTRLQSGEWDIFYGGYDVLAPEGIAAAESDGPGLRWATAELPIQLGHFIAFRGHHIGAMVAYLEIMLTRPPGHPDGGPMDVDGAYNWYRKGRNDLTTLLADPQLGYQRSSPSSIAGPNWFDRLPMISGVAALARRLRNR